MNPRSFRSSSPRKARTLFGATAAVAILSGPIQAQTTRNWDGSEGANWSDNLNWSGDTLPGVLDTAAFNAQTAQQTVQLTGGPFEIQNLNFTANTSSAYTLQNGALILNAINQTADDSNVLNASVTLTTKNAGADILTVNVTSNSLQLQGQITSGGFIKNGGSTVRLGTSGTAFNNAINGDILINGGTFQAAAGATAGVNNPLGGTGNIVIGNSGVTLSLQAQTHYNFVRPVVANDRSFTFTGSAAASDPGDFNMTVGKVTIGNATMTSTSGAGYRVRTEELAINSGATTTVNTGAWTFAGALSGDAATKIVKTGTSDFIIEGNETNASTFAGDIDHDNGWLRLESTAAANQPLGNAGTTINITSAINNPKVSLRANGATTFDNVNINAGNNNFQLDVRHLAGTNTTQTLQAGTVTIGNATLDLIGQDAFNARLAGISINSGATAIVNVNSNGEGVGGQSLRVDSLVGDVTTTLQKNGGQSLFISAADNSSFLGRIQLNGGTSQIEGESGLSPVLNSAGLTFMASSQVNLRSSTALDFGAPIDFGPGVAGATIFVGRSGTSATNLYLTVGEINLSGGALLNGAIRTLTVNQGDSYDLEADSLRLDAGQTSQLVLNTDFRANALALAAGSTLIKRGGGTFHLTSDNSATSAGEIILTSGAITTSVTGSLGTGVVTVGEATPNSAGFIANNAQLNWNGSGLSGNTTGADVVVVAGGVVDLNATPDAGDFFNLQADGRIKGNAAQLAALTVGTNLTLAADATIIHEGPGATTGSVTGLANNANLYYGIGNNASSLPEIGVGTPWKGISGETTSRSITGGTLTIHGGDNNAATIEGTFQSVFNASLDFSSNYTFASSAVGGEKVTLAVNSTLGSGFGSVPGGLVILRRDASSSGLTAAVDKIIVQNGGLSLSTLNALGGVPVEVQDNGLLDIGNLAGNVLDGDVNFKSGGLFVFNDAQILAGTGTLTFEGGSKLDIGGAPATFFTDATQTMNFTGTGHTVRFTADEITNLDSTIPDAGAIFVVSNGAATSGPLADNFGSTNIQDLSINTQSAGLTTDGGVITNAGGSVGLNAPLTIGPNGATFAATRNTTFVVNSAVNTTGDIQVGSATAIDNRDKSTNTTFLNGFGQPEPFNNNTFVYFGGDLTANKVTITNQFVGFMSGNVTIAGDLSITGGAVYLDGGGSAGGTQGQLTAKLAAGTLAERILLNNFTRADMKLDLGSTAGAVLEIDTPFVISGDVNPQDNRRIFASRNSGANTRVNFNDITLNSGAEFAFDEENTDIRASFKLAGNATAFRGSHDDFDYIDVTRAATLPAFTGSNPVVLTQGKINVTGISGFQSANSNVFGNIAAGVQIDLVRGQLFFQPTATLDGVVRAQTAQLGGDAFILSTSNGSTTATALESPANTGRIEIGRSMVNGGTAEDFEVRGTEVASGPAPLHTVAVPIRVVDDGTSALDAVIRSQRHNDSTIAASVQVNRVDLAPGATVQLTTSNAIPLPVGTVNLEGAGTIDVGTTGVTIGTLNASATGAVSFTGFATTIGSGITAAELNVANGATIAGAVSTTGAVNLAGGTTSFASGVTASQIVATDANATIAGDVATTQTNSVTRGVVTFNGSVASGLNITTGAATFNAGGGTKTVGGTVALDAGMLAVNNGTLDLGTNLITSTSSSMVAGLREQKITGNSFDLGTANTSNIVRLGPVMAQTTLGWGINETYVYSGQFFVPDNDAPGDNMGIVSFAENFDDSVRIQIDGVTRLLNQAWNDATGTGALALASGWHDIEIRLGQGGGGAGPNNNDGWNLTLGLGIDRDDSDGIDSSTSSPLRAQYVAPLDDGSMNLFRSTVSSGVDVANGSTLLAAGITNAGSLNLAGTARVKLNGTGAALVSSLTNLNVAASANARLEVTRAADSLSVENANLNGALEYNGAGNLVLTGTGTGAGALTVNSTGTVFVNGSISGAVNVAAGTLGGSGTIAGAVTVSGAGTLAPGNSAGTLTTGPLSLASTSTSDFELTLRDTTVGGGINDLVVINGDLTLDGTLAITMLGTGSLLGDNLDTYVLFDYSGTLLDNGLTIDPAFMAMYPSAEIIIDMANTQVLIAVPEPGSAVMLLAGLASLAGLQRFRRRLS